jgi:hypothetical protein
LRILPALAVPPPQNRWIAPVVSASIGMLRPEEEIMGLLNKMFGGGTSLEIQLDTPTVPEGAFVAGSLTVGGGKKPLTIDALKVTLVYINVTQDDDSPLPNVEMKVLADNTVIANEDLAPGSSQKYSFKFQVPKGTDPAGTYKIKAVADIPGVKDPSADVDLKVIAPRQGKGGGGFLDKLMGRGPSHDDILAEFPELLSQDQDEVQDALLNLRCEAYDEEKNFTAIAPFLLDLAMKTSDERTQMEAIDAWGTVLDNRAKPEHIAALAEMCNNMNAYPERVQRSLVEVAARFAEEGAWEIFLSIAQSQNSERRADAAINLYLNADKDLQGRRDLLVQLTQDSDAEVRSKACPGLSEYTADAEIVQYLAQLASSDPSPDVQKEALSAATSARWHGQEDYVYQLLQAHLQNPNASVREEIARRLHMMPTDPRVGQLVQGLLSDGDVGVRRDMAWQSRNMEDHPELRDLFLWSAQQDPDPEVRGAALGGIHALIGGPDALGLIRNVMTNDPNDHSYWAAFEIARDLEDELPTAKELLMELQNAPFVNVADAVRRHLSDY